MDTERKLPTWVETYGLGIGFASAAFSNYGSGRPIVSRFPLYAIYGTLGFIGFHFFEQWSARRHIARDVYLMDYVRLHPEDFPELEKKQFKDVLQTWYPRR